MEIETATDRRRYKRYRVREGALAFLGPIPATIIDISQGGMSVNYIFLKKIPEQNLKLDIFFPEEDFFLPDISAFVVSDIVCPARAPFTAVQVRRLGIKFGELSSKQEASLKHYLHNNVIAEV